ncbi:L,D-transpeptidase family protein [Butyrivibrio fibrisolvens]|uniref:L,D-transpeptidase family protein n=1 Tax=Butyrivibrio fibrisolvens TaxID=831 RepID=UPI0020C06BA9|nr:L,D-transpeptidase family protein [Butyrivibrio fibrisolvens]
MKKKNLILIIAATTVAAIYLGAATFFSFHFCPGSKLNGQDISWMTISQVRDLVDSKASSYVLDIVGRSGLDEKITASDISWKPDFNESLNDNLGFVNGLKWPVYVLSHRSFTNEDMASFDEELLKSKINSMSFFKEENMISPVDAQLVFDETLAEYTIVPEDYGSKADRDAFYEAVVEALSTMQMTLSLDKAGVYEEPKILSDNKALTDECQSLNKYASAKITYTFGDDVITVDGNYIKDWISYDGTTTTLDTDKVNEFVNTLGRTYDTFGRDRTFTTSLGQTITVSGGDYGWWMDRDTTLSELVTAIESTSICDMTPVYFGTAAQYGSQDYGTSYVEVDLDHQHVYVYENGSLVIDTDCVSGKATNDRVTPTGTFGITYKERDATLTGQNYSSDVKYWMPFYGNVGLHDASWRSSFGSDIYVTNGSHGCINLPPDAAAVIFEHVEKGEAVIVYGGIQPSQAKDYLKNKDKSEEGNTDNTDDGDSAAGDGNSQAPVAPENTGTPDATDASSNVPTPDTSTDESLAVPESTDPSEQISGSGE